MKFIATALALICLAQMLQLQVLAQREEAEHGWCPGHTSRIETCPQNEEFVCCGSACQTLCGNPSCHLNNIRCPDGCYCKNDYARNTAGKCIRKSQC